MSPHSSLQRNVLFSTFDICSATLLQLDVASLQDTIGYLEEPDIDAFQ